jgi:hypothetical protein
LLSPRSKEGGKENGEDGSNGGGGRTKDGRHEETTQNKTDRNKTELKRVGQNINQTNEKDDKT